MDNKKKPPSCVAIVLWFIFFWPVGVYFLIKKLSSDETTTLKKSKVLFGIGLFFIFAFVIMLSEGFGGEIDTRTAVFGSIFYLVSGILLIYLAKRTKDSGERHKRLINIIINQQERTIENIASQVVLSYDATVKELQKMIDKGVFNGAYIDYGKHEIVIPTKAEEVPINQTTVIYPKQKVVKCPNCGGNNVIFVGQVCVCDFCGSPIE